VLRLQKYLAACGIASRRKAEELIEQGRVSVNGQVAHVGESVDPSVDVVEFDGVAVTAERKVYIILNKPEGVVTTAKDTHRRKTVMDCLEGVNARVFPVGRLDLDVEGALLLTNDGELSNRLMHPRYEIQKVYMAWVRGRVTQEDAARLRRGIELDDGMTAPAGIDILERQPDRTLVRLCLHEGRKREVKRMLDAVGHRVISLRRVSVAGIDAQGLRVGEWRYLGKQEISQLMRLAGLQ